jgi:hypothetical protein
MTTLEKIFYKCNEFKIYPCLDNSYCYTDTKIKIPKNYIGCIYSITNIDEILESISEEGSSTINYKIKSTKFTEKIINIFSTILIEHGYDPYIEDDIVSIVISYEDLFGHIKNEEYLEEDDEDDEDDEEEYTEDDEDHVDVKINEVKDDEVDEVDEVEDEVENLKEDDDHEDVKEDDHEIEKDDDDEDDHEIEKDDDDEDDHEVEKDDDDEDDHEVENVKEDDDHEEDVKEEIANVEEYTHEKLKKKYRAELVELAQNLGISVWKGKNIHKHLKSDIIDCIILFKKNDF